MKRVTKKIAGGILAVLLLLSVGTMSVLAAGRGNHRNFTDKDGDGVCDCYTVHQKCESSQKDYRKNFVDKDEDGVCDNHASSQSTGQGRGLRGGRGR